MKKWCTVKTQISGQENKGRNILMKPVSAQQGPKDMNERIQYITSSHHREEGGRGGGIFIPDRYILCYMIYNLILPIDTNGSLSPFIVLPLLLGCEKQCLAYEPFHSWEWSMSKFPCSLTRHITSHSIENLTFHSLLRWKVIILQILATSLIQSLFERLGEYTFWAQERKG